METSREGRGVSKNVSWVVFAVIVALVLILVCYLASPWVLAVYFWTHGVDWCRSVQAAMNIRSSGFHTDQFVRDRLLNLMRIVRKDTTVSFRLACQMSRLRKISREGVAELDDLESIFGSHIDPLLVRRIESEIGMIIL